MYFDSPGSQNSKQTAELALSAARQYGIKDIVVASRTGGTVELFGYPDDINLICVTHAFGFHENGTNSMSRETRQALEAKGVRVITATHVLSGVERALSTKFGGINPVEIIAHTLRLLGQGVKVAVEIATMAADAGLIKPGVPVIAVGGTRDGADTAIILRAAHANRFFETKIDRIICKPLI